MTNMRPKSSIDLWFFWLGCVHFCFLFLSVALLISMSILVIGSVASAVLHMKINNKKKRPKSQITAHFRPADVFTRSICQKNASFWCVLEPTVLEFTILKMMHFHCRQNASLQVLLFSLSHLFCFTWRMHIV